MATARKLPSGSWRVRQYIGEDASGKKLYKSFTASTKKEAEFAAAEYMLTRKEKTVPVQMTVGEAIDKYIDNKDAILSPSTIREYRRMRKNYLLDIMPINLSALTQETIQEAVNSGAAKHSPKTIRNAHGLLSAALAEAIPNFPLHTKLPARRKVLISIPEDSAIKSLIDEAGECLRAAIVVSAFLGLRRSELCALTRDDIKDGSIIVNKAVVLNDKKEWVLKDTKTYSSTREVKAPKFVVDMLRALPNITDRVIPLWPNDVTRRFCTLRKRLGFAFRFHDLRHYHASIMLALGVPDKYAMEQMGHATPNMLKTVYQHTIASKKDEFSERLEEHANKIYATKCDTKTKMT